MARHAEGRRALDFGCGAGRSTRFLKAQGFEAVGIDISSPMVELARTADAGGDYRVVPDGDFSGLAAASFDVVLSAFAFDNIPGREKRAALLRGLKDLLAPGGRIFLLGSAPEIYWKEWASFTTADFPENRSATSGGEVRIVMKDVTDARPVVDLIWFPGDYRDLFASAGLALIEEHLPLGRHGEAAWIAEERVAPWVIYVLRAGLQ